MFRASRQPGYLIPRQEQGGERVRNRTCALCVGVHFLSEITDISQEGARRPSVSVRGLGSGVLTLHILTHRKGEKSLTLESDVCFLGLGSRNFKAAHKAKISFRECCVLLKISQMRMSKATSCS